MKMLLSLLIVGFSSFALAYDGSTQKEITADEIIRKINENLKTESTSSLCTSNGKAVISKNLSLETLIGADSYDRTNSLNESAGIYRSNYGLMVQINGSSFAITRATKGDDSSILVRTINLKYSKTKDSLSVQELTTVNSRGETQSITSCLYNFDL